MALGVSIRGVLDSYRTSLQRSQQLAGKDLSNLEEANKLNTTISGYLHINHDRISSRQTPLRGDQV
jgi:hypothetical protein